MMFSVVIPTFNRAALLEETLRSVSGQRFTDFEVIVVDDGSTDATSALLTARGETVRYLHSSRSGPGAARNLGARHARGRYLAFLDSDDLWFPWTLQVYADVIQRNNEPAFVTGSPHYFRTPDELKSIEECPARFANFDDYYAASGQWRWWGASAFVVLRDSFLEVGGFTEAKINGEDADLAMRLGLARGYVQVAAPVTFGYRKHDATAMSLFDRTVDGANFVLGQERGSKYPGDAARRPERRRILGRHLRSVAWEALERHRKRDAWILYWSTFVWHLTLGNWRFLFGFPVIALQKVLR